MKCLQFGLELDSLGEPKLIICQKQSRADLSKSLDGRDPRKTRAMMQGQARVSHLTEHQPPPSPT